MGGVVDKVVKVASLGVIDADGKKPTKDARVGGTSYSQEDMDQAGRKRRQRNAATARKAEVNTTLTRTDTLG
jgi:hypothetical protein